MRTMSSRAREYAMKMHGAQRYGNMPYSTHLDAVASIVADATDNDDVIMAVAYLHDVVEDTAATVNDVEWRFGSEVADAVALLTDAPGQNRRERKTKTYARLGASKNYVARLVKLADRLVNVRASSEGDTASSRLLDTYRREHAAFRDATYGTDQSIEDELDRLLSWNVHVEGDLDE